MKVLVSLLPCLFCLNYSVYAFVPTSFRRVTLQCESQLRVSVTQEDVRYQDYQLTDEQVKPIVRLGKGDKEKVINLYGLSCVAVTLLTCPFWGASMSLLKMIHEMNPEFDTNRELYDRTGKIWSRLWLSMTGSYPTFSGNIEELRRGQGPCLYVANHASWLDIPIICTVLDPVFKFIAKAELAQLPCIGQQLKGVS
jgi:1-acyl-sn-glycerol-3-phosphate acyltransferase